MLSFPIHIGEATIMSEDINKFLRQGKIRDAITFIIDQTGCSEKEAEDVIDDIRSMQKDIQVSKTERPKRITKQYEQDILYCPKCGSTHITTGARGVNALFGFIGASKTVNRCGKCGYTWKP